MLCKNHIINLTYFLIYAECEKVCFFLLQLDVKEAKIVTDHPQWNISDDEDKEKNDDESEEEEDSDYSSEDGSD